jgi:hypothetical protein
MKKMPNRLMCILHSRYNSIAAENLTGEERFLILPGALRRYIEAFHYSTEFSWFTMSEEKKLLIVAHQPSPNTRTLVEATLRGARTEELDGIKVSFIPPLEASADDVLWADAIILGTTENFGYMSGALKDFFDRIYYPCLDKTDALPYALYIRAGLDGTGTKRAVENICKGLRWKPVQPAMILHGEYRSEFKDQCHDLGMLMAVSLNTGII